MPILILCVILLLPLLPVYPLFRYLPSSATVSGPLKGMEIKLGGAFAGYFALVLIGLIYFAPSWEAPKAYQVWVAKGKLTDANGHVLPGPLDPTKDIQMVPPLVTNLGNGLFEAHFVPIPDQSGGLAYPAFTFGHDSYSSITIPLDPTTADQVDKSITITRNPLKHMIDLHDIRLQPLQPYTAAGTLPQPGIPPPTQNPSH